MSSVKGFFWKDKVAFVCVVVLLFDPGWFLWLSPARRQQSHFIEVDLQLTKQIFFLLRDRTQSLQSPKQFLPLFGVWSAFGNIYSVSKRVNVTLFWVDFRISSSAGGVVMISFITRSRRFTVHPQSARLCTQTLSKRVVTKIQTSFKPSQVNK